MTKRLLITFVFIFFSLLSLSQDVVYDSIQGDRSRWLRIKGGPQEDTTLQIMYENLGMLTKSKVLSAAGLLDGLTENIHYKMYHFNYDTVTFEFKTDEPVNCIIYRYFYNDTTFRYFVGFRKASLGDDMFDGQYMIISPLIVEESVTKIYDGIGANRELVLTLTPGELNESSLRDYQLSNAVTLQGIKVSKDLRASKTEEFITYINDNFYNEIEIWPIPVAKILNIKIPSNPGVIVRIYDVLPILVYQNLIDTEITEIDVSGYKSGMYFIMIIDSKNGVLLRVIKFVKI